MISGILTIISSAVSAVSGIFKLKSSANRQRREAEQDVRSAAESLEQKKQEIRSAVYEFDDDKLNEIATKLLSILLISLCLVGCASKPVTIYVATDRKIESCTNSLGIACKAVPNAVMADILSRLEEFEALKTEKAVDKRLEK